MSPTGRAGGAGTGGTTRSPVASRGIRPPFPDVTTDALARVSRAARPRT